MRSRHALLSLSPSEALLELLLLLLLGGRVLAVCPSACSCSHSHREVDCSWRGLRQLPDGLQHNLRSLNLSHNRLHDLDGRLTEHTHLRLLDLSHNRLGRVPAGLPRSLWQLHAAHNHIQRLDKNDTVYQWNLRTLDLSHNKLERAIFINNTLINLCTLNFSNNRLWTVPTNLPAHLETIDLSHNMLLKVLPGSLERLSRLTHFYLHANRFSMLPFGVLDKLTSLRVVTLGENPWACHVYDDISYLLSWAQRTPARIMGCPCHTHPVCGGVRPGRTGGWHFASYNLPPLAASAQEASSSSPEESMTGWWYVSAQISTTEGAGTARPTSATASDPTVHHLAAEHMLVTEKALLVTEKALLGTPAHTETPDDDEQTPTDATAGTDPPTTQSASVRTKKTTTLRTRSVRRHNQSHPGGISSGGPALSACFALSVLPKLLALTLRQAL